MERENQGLISTKKPILPFERIGFLVEGIPKYIVPLVTFAQSQK